MSFVKQLGKQCAAYVLLSYGGDAVEDGLVKDAVGEAQVFNRALTLSLATSHGCHCAGAAAARCAVGRMVACAARTGSSVAAWWRCCGSSVGRCGLLLSHENRLVVIGVVTREVDGSAHWLFLINNLRAICSQQTKRGVSVKIFKKQKSAFR